MKDVVLIFLNVFILSLLCEIIYWTSSVFIVFNPTMLEGGYYGFLYYMLPMLVLLILGSVIVLINKKVPNFWRNLLFLMINTYGILCVIMITGEYCDPVKNLDWLYSVLISLSLIVVGVILLKKVIPGMGWRNLLIVGLSTVITYLDFNYFLIGYHLFYPENW